MSLAQQLVAELTVQNDLVLASYVPSPTAGKLYNNAGVLYWGAAPIAAGGGTVTSFSAGNLIPLFSTSVATATSTPALTFALSTVAANKALMGPTSGADAAWAARLLVAADIPDISATYQPLLAYTPENVANKSTSGALGVSDTLYPSQKAVKTYADTKEPALGNPGTTGFVLSSTTGGVRSWVAAGVPALTSAHLFVGNVSNVATDVAMTGDISITNAGLTAIGANKVTLAMMATIANNTVLGNISGGAAVPSALTGANVRTICGLATTDTPTFASFQINGPALGHAFAQLMSDTDYGAGFKMGELGGGYQAAIIWNFNVGPGLEFYTGGVTTANCNMYLDQNGKLTLRGAGGLQTPAPAGGTAGVWKLGILVTTASVFDTTRYIQLDVGGVLYKVAVCV